MNVRFPDCGLLEGLKGMALLGKVCHRGWVLWLHKSMPDLFLISFSPLSSLSPHATYQSWIRCKFSAAATKNACCYVPHHGDHRLIFWNYEQNHNQLNVFFHQLPWSLCLFTAIKMENDYHRQVGTIIIWFMENEANIYSFWKKNDEICWIFVFFWPH